ncbi:MAG TPA: cell division protein FtsL [Terriglobales bacterium]|nr:cell division protein FtsL [Terriglobales bacterium]
MAAGALAGTPQIRSPWGPSLRPRAATALRGTPEIYFAKAIDNSRLVKVADRQRNREMAVFVATLCVLFALVMVYAWQHFSAIEYGYKIEAQRTQRDSLVELNRTLRLEEASLRDPERIDTLARQMGLEMPQAGQVISLELPAGNAAAPVLARAAAAPVVTVEQ